MTDAQPNREAQQEGTWKLNEAGERLLADLFAMARNTRVFQPGHPVLVEAAARIHVHLEQARAVEHQVALHFVHDAVFLNELRLRLPRAMFVVVRHLAGLMAERELGGIQFLPESTPASLHDDLCLLFSADKAPKVYKGIQALPAKADVETLLASEEGQQLEQALVAYGKAVHFVKIFCQALESGRVPRLGVGRRVIQDLVEVALEQPHRFVNLASIRDYEAAPYSHAGATCVLALACGLELKLDRADLVELGLAALLHSAGWAFLPNRMMAGEGAHDRRHLELLPLHSVRAMLSTGGTTPAALRRVIVAHERAQAFSDHLRDRRLGRPGHAFQSRLVAVCARQATLTRAGPGRAALLPDEALAQLLVEADQQLDGRLVRLLVQVLGLFPPGTWVSLDTGERGVVLYTRSDASLLDRPVVRVLQDGLGRRIPERVVDLARADASGRYPGKVVSTLAPPPGFDDRQI